MMIPVDVFLALGAIYKKTSADESIFREGYGGHFYYQLISGSFRCVSISDDGKEFKQNMIDPVESFGELLLFDDAVYATYSIANKDSVLPCLHKNTFHQLLKEDPDTHFAFRKLMARRMRFNFLLLKELACGDREHSTVTLFSHFKRVEKK